MKVLHVTTGMRKASGVTTFVENVTAELKRRGVEATVAMKVSDFAPCDVVHIHGLWSPLLHRASKWARENGIPVVWSTHGMSAPWSMRHKWWKKLPAWWLYQKWDLKRAAAIHCTTDLEVEWNRKLGFKNCFVAPLGTNERCLNAAQSVFREVKALDRKALAEKKVEEWMEGVTRESYFAALESLVDDSIRTGELPIRSADERQKILEGAQSFFAFFAHSIVELSDGRCVYFAPDPRSRLRKISNAQAWAEYSIHGVTNGGGAIPGKPYHMRWYNHRKVENADLIVPTLRAENCFDTLKKNPVADSIKFFGKTHEGGYFDVVVRLDEFGNANANMTEVTFEASKDKKRKYPRFKPLAEAVEAVVCHQAAGTNPSTKNIVSKSSVPCKGVLKALFVGRIYPVKGLVNLVKAAARIKQSNNPNNRTILFRIVGPDQAGHQAELMKLADELGVSDMFEWPGPKFGDELSAEYDHCDLLVLPSFTENFGGVVIDALAHGKPVIASKFTPWKVLEDEHCGWWVSNDSDSLFATFQSVIEQSNNRTILQAMGQRGHQLVLDRYTWSAVCEKMVRGYVKVIGG